MDMNCLPPALQNSNKTITWCCLEVIWHAKSVGCLVTSDSVLITASRLFFSLPRFSLVQDFNERQLLSSLYVYQHMTFNFMLSSYIISRLLLEAIIRNFNWRSQPQARAHQKHGRLMLHSKNKKYCREWTSVGFTGRNARNALRLMIIIKTYIFVVPFRKIKI